MITQTTIGYGTADLKFDHCGEALAVIVVQTLVGTALNAAFLGLLYARLSPARRPSGSGARERERTRRTQPGERSSISRLGGKRVIFSHLSRLVSRSVFTRFDSFLDERSSLVEFSKSGHFL